MSSANVILTFWFVSKKVPTIAVEEFRHLYNEGLPLFQGLGRIFVTYALEWENIISKVLTLICLNLLFWQEYHWEHLKRTQHNLGTNIGFHHQTWTTINVKFS